MTNDKIAEIRARHDAVNNVLRGASQMHDDRGYLLAEVERLREALRWYADLSNHLPVERRNPGDPDPAVVVLDEPPILRDNGTLARAALEAKP